MCGKEANRLSQNHFYLFLLCSIRSDSKTKFNIAISPKSSTFLIKNNSTI